MDEQTLNYQVEFEASDFIDELTDEALDRSAVTAASGGYTVGGCQLSQ